MSKRLFVACMLLALPSLAAEADHEIHQELRGILLTVQNAVNSGNFDAMLPVLSKDIEATTITQEVMHGHQEVSAYFKKWFGPGGYLKKLQMQFTADALTELSADKSWGCRARLGHRELHAGRRPEVRHEVALDGHGGQGGGWEMAAADHSLRHELP